jgi:hypothetical protein
MVEESVPVEINGERYSLRFEDGDVMAIEQQFRPIAMLFKPEMFGFDVARVFLWKGLKKMQQDGTLTYAFTQDKAGYEEALQMVKKFTGQFTTVTAPDKQQIPGMVLGLSVLFGMVNKALIISGWYRDPEAPRDPNEKTREIDPSKNSARPTKRPTKRSRMGSAD